MWKIIGVLAEKSLTRFSQGIEAAALPKVWEEALEEHCPHALPFAQFAQLRDDKVVIRVSDPLWIGELSARREQLREALNHDRKTPIKGILFTL